MIADDLVEEVRVQADIVQIVGERVALRRSGRTYRGPCPLHGGEGPNFSVDPQRGIFKCFVCGEGGDVFSFPMKLLGLDFVDAVRYVAERSGVHIPERPESEPDPYGDLRGTVAFAAEWFQGQLWEDKGGEPARRYLLEERELSEDAVRRFGLGYAPDSWRALREAAAVHDIDDELLIRAGLVRESERAKEPYDLFRGRLIFPIYDLRDRVIAFGGRRLTGPDDAPKYINSPDSPIFHKGRVVYGLNWSRHAIRREEVVLIVEGYTDFISLAARDIENAAAPLGTSLTEEQARLLKRYARSAVLLYDSDQPGLRATFRAADELLRAGVHPRVATLPPEEDPDSLVRRHGPSELSSYVESSVDVVDRKVQILGARGYLDSIEGRRRAVDALMPTVRAAEDAALRDIYLDRVASVTGVRRTTLERELLEETRTRRRRSARRSRPTRPTDESRPRLGPERVLLLLLLRDPSLVRQVAAEVEPEDFRTAEYREIYEALNRASKSGNGAASAEVWKEQLSSSARRTVAELAADPEELTHPEGVLDDAVKRLHRRRLERRRDELKTEMLLAETSERTEELLAEIYSINQELAALGRRVMGWGFLRRKQSTFHRQEE